MQARPPLPGEHDQETLQWLLDRAEIAECLLRYASCIDRRDWSGLQDLYTEDGVMQHGDASVGRDAVPELSEKILTGCAASHHLVGDPSIVIEGDTARTHSHYFATHISEGTTVKRQGGGWYDCDLRRTSDGWRFTRVRSTTAWRIGEPLQLH
jgi:ketosteroid isomerase-like protein